MLWQKNGDTSDIAQRFSHEALLPRIHSQDLTDKFPFSLACILPTPASHYLGFTPQTPVMGSPFLRCGVLVLGSACGVSLSQTLLLWAFSFVLLILSLERILKLSLQGLDAAGNMEP